MVSELVCVDDCSCICVCAHVQGNIYVCLCAYIFGNSTKKLFKLPVCCFVGHQSHCRFNLCALLVVVAFIFGGRISPLHSSGEKGLLPGAYILLFNPL